MSLDVTLYYPVANDDPEDRKHIVFEANITHNLGALANALGVYGKIWRPSILKACDMTEHLELAIDTLTEYPDKYTPFLPKNGWGTIEEFMDFLRKYLHACRKYPNSLIEVSV